MNNNFYDSPFDADHDHVFLGAGHEKNERKTWAEIALCTAMMVVEIVGGKLFGSLALVADGLHMPTHAGAMLVDASLDTKMQAKMEAVIEEVGDKLNDLHIWRLGPGNLGATVSVTTTETQHDPLFYHQRLRRFKGLPHLAVEEQPRMAA